MAQSKSFFGLRKGSTKSLTFSVYNGKQVTKDRLTEVKNTRSSLQMVQRAYMATALRGYSALKEICDHSFEGIAYGQKSMNYFVAENARMIRAAAPNVNLSLFKGNSVPNAYMIAKGSIPEVILIANSGDTSFELQKSLGATFTFGDFMAAFGATKVSDMVTFVSLVANPGSNASVYWVRLKLTDSNKSKSFNASESPNVIASLTEGTDFETNMDKFTANDFTISYLNDSSTISIKVEKDFILQSMGVIVSRKSDTGWLRSSSTMVNLVETFNFDNALATYPTTGAVILNGGSI